ncbi:hypothetical protein VAC51_00011 [Variovorax phage VAC_51]|uniref:Uncharacterized protein n=1 Tax=Variovorax phage VAC_51 TaxID=2985242 RepID=A0A9N6WTX4_9CAUD|nr:hypothetical protein VAC51_00011 [Variovorax phage VAC_51]
MPIEFNLPHGAGDLDLSHKWRDLPYEQRMVYIATMARHWFKVL